MNGKYENHPQEWIEQLENHLLKSEIQWVASNGGGTVDFLRPYCGSVETLKSYLKWIGFKVVRTTEEIGNTIWLETTDRISISVDGEFEGEHDPGGYCYKSKGRKVRR